MIKSHFHEALNGHLFVLAFYAYCIFLRYLWRERHASYEDLRAALAISVVLLGEWLIRGCYWWVRHQINLDVAIGHEWFYLGAVIGAVIQTLGFIFTIRVFSPRNCGPLSWVSALLLSMAWTYSWMFLDM